MANAKCCDNCGVLFKLPLNRKEETSYNGVHFYTQYVNDASFQTKGMDICPDCITAITLAFAKRQQIVSGKEVNE